MTPLACSRVRQVGMDVDSGPAPEAGGQCEDDAIQAADLQLAVVAPLPPIRGRRHPRASAGAAAVRELQRACCGPRHILNFQGHAFPSLEGRSFNTIPNIGRQVISLRGGVLCMVGPTLGPVSLLWMLVMLFSRSGPAGGKVRHSSTAASRVDFQGSVCLLGSGPVGSFGTAAATASRVDLSSSLGRAWLDFISLSESFVRVCWSSRSKADARLA